MRTLFIRSLLFGMVTLFLLVGFDSARADVAVSFNISGNPPPLRTEHRWTRPHPDAQWVPGHYEWNRRWVWVSGYYAYPPYPGSRWYSGHFENGWWVPGHWTRPNRPPPGAGYPDDPGWNSGYPPMPPPREDYRWPRPSPNAQWIEGHYEWNNRWVWISGYYAYPPRPGARYITGRFIQGRWVPGHWFY